MLLCSFSGSDGHLSGKSTKATTGALGRLFECHIEWSSSLRLLPVEALEWSRPLMSGSPFYLPVGEVIHIGSTVPKKWHHVSWEVPRSQIMSMVATVQLEGDEAECLWPFGAIFAFVWDAFYPVRFRFPPWFWENQKFSSSCQNRQERGPTLAPAYTFTSTSKLTLKLQLAVWRVKNKQQLTVGRTNISTFICVRLSNCLVMCVCNCHFDTRQLYRRSWQF